MKIKAGPNAARNRFAFRVTPELRIECGGSPVSVPSTTKGSGDKTIDVEAMCERYAQAGYIEIVDRGKQKATG